MLPRTLVVMLVLATAAADNAAKDDVKKAQGDWRFVAVEINGKDATDNFKDAKVAVKDDKVTVKLPDGETVAWTLKADGSTKPKCIDFKNDKGETSEGIYELKDDELKVCVSFKAGASERPTDFTTSEGSDRVLWKLRRIKP